MKTVIICFLMLFTALAAHSQQGGFTGEGRQGFTDGAQQGFGANRAQEQWQTGGPRHGGPRGAGYGQGLHRGYMGTGVMPVMCHELITISQAAALPHDSWVILNGNIVSMMPGGRNYTFRDSSGEVIADIGPREWRGLSVGASDNVTIYGEVKNYRGIPSVRVHAITGSGRTNTWPNQSVFINRPVTIREAVASPHDSFVILNGNIVNAQVRRNAYTFRDSSGEITVDIGLKEWRGLSVDASDNVEIFGEVKHHRGGFTTIRVHAIRAL